MKRAVVTGSNRGIGLEFCSQLKDAGYEVIAICRKSSAELQALNIDVHENMDVTNQLHLNWLRDELKKTSIDLLINNAGVLHPDSLEELDFELLREQFEVNALAPIHLTKTLLPLMNHPSKVAMVTSRMGSISDNTSGGFYGYRMSKAALNMASVSLAHDLRTQGITICILHPGYVQTDMTNHKGALSTEESVRGMIARINELEIDHSGTFWHSNGKQLNW